MMELILGAALLTSGSSADVLSSLDCQGSQELIERIQKSRVDVEHKEELVAVIKDNTEPQCYERPENT